VLFLIKSRKAIFVYKDMKNEKIRLIHPSDFKNHVRTRYLEIVASMKPEAFEELRLISLPLVHKSGVKELLNPFVKTTFKWEDFEAGRKTNGKLLDLRDNLISWQEQFNLVENEVSDKWVLRWLVFDVLIYWSNSSNVVRKKHLFQPVGKRFQLLPSVPAFKSPDFVINDVMSKIQYIEKSSGEFIDWVLGEHRKLLEGYCKSMEKTVISYGWKSIDDVPVRNLILLLLESLIY
jgi:hypothetical protein